MAESSPQRKLQKPYEGFPLTPHKRGYWVKKINGVQRQIGERWATPEEALAEWNLVRDKFMLGVVETKEVLTLDLALNYVLNGKERAVADKELSNRHYQDLKSECKFIKKHISPNKLITEVGPVEFAKLRQAMRDSKLSLKTQHSKIARIRLVFNYLKKLKEITSVDFGPEFDKPSESALRREREDKLVDYKVLTPAQILKLVATAQPQLKAMILLGINCAYNNTDCSLLKWSDIGEDGWIRRARNKTGMPRSAKLWPETLAAINAVAKRNGDKLVFRTKHGNPWVHTDSGFVDNALSKAFRALAKQCGIKATFKDLRSLFQTVAEEVCFDAVAIRAVMGHVDKTMAGQYRKRVLDKRVFEVCKAMRNWLYSKKAVKKETAAAAS